MQASAQRVFSCRAVQSSWTPFGSACTCFVAAKLLNEHLTAFQWLAYGVAQAAAMALWAGHGSSGGSGKLVGFTRLPPVLG
jgi:hypothetical protein